jgi:hypothetical protein
MRMGSSAARLNALAIATSCRIRAATAKVVPLAPATHDRLDCAKVRGAFARCVDADARSARQPVLRARRNHRRRCCLRLRGGPFHLHFCLKGDDRGIPSVHLPQYEPETVHWRRDGRPGSARTLEFNAATRLPALPGRA